MQKSEEVGRALWGVQIEDTIVKLCGAIKFLPDGIGVSIGQSNSIAVNISKREDEWNSASKIKSQRTYL